MCGNVRRKRKGAKRTHRVARARRKVRECAGRCGANPNTQNEPTAPVAADTGLRQLAPVYVIRDLAKRTHRGGEWQFGHIAAENTGRR